MTKEELLKQKEEIDKELKKFETEEKRKKTYQLKADIKKYCKEKNIKTDEDILKWIRGIIYPKPRAKKKTEEK